MRSGSWSPRASSIHHHPHDVRRGSEEVKNGNSDKVAVPTPGEAHNPPVHFYITYDASAATMATMGDFEEISKIDLLAPPLDLV